MTLLNNNLLIEKINFFNLDKETKIRHQILNKKTNILSLYKGCNYKTTNTKTCIINISTEKVYRIQVDSKHKLKLDITNIITKQRRNLEKNIQLEF